MRARRRIGIGLAVALGVVVVAFAVLLALPSGCACEAMPPAFTLGEPTLVGDRALHPVVGTEPGWGVDLAEVARLRLFLMEPDGSEGRELLYTQGPPSSSEWSVWSGDVRAGPTHRIDVGDRLDVPAGQGVLMDSYGVMRGPLTPVRS